MSRGNEGNEERTEPYRRYAVITGLRRIPRKWMM